MSVELNKQENEETTDTPENVRETDEEIQTDSGASQKEAAGEVPADSAASDYTGILGDFVEQEDTAEAAEAPASKKSASRSPLAIAGICISALALAGAGTFGVMHFRKVMPKTASSTARARVTDRMAACYMQDTLNMYVNYYGGADAIKSYLGLDVNAPLSSQDTGDGTTWLDTMLDYTKNSVNQYLVLREAGMNEGFVLPAEDRKAIEDALVNVDLSRFGNGVTVADLREALVLQAYAAGVYNEKYDSFTFTDDEIETYITENGSEYITCGLLGFSISYDQEDEAADSGSSDAETEETTEAETKKSMSQETAKKLATALEGAKSEEDFENQVSDILIEYEGYSSEELTSILPTIRNDSFSFMPNNELADWAFDDATQVGNTLLIESENHYNVYYLTRKPVRDDSTTINVRHILFGIDDHLNQSGEEVTEEDRAAALEECRALAQAALDEWSGGEATEDSFAELANRVSEDPGSNTTGGLYENVYEGQMVDEFNDWCFDASRAVGDTGLVETAYGVHVMFFSGKGDPLWKSGAVNAMRSEQYANWYAQQEALYPVTVDDAVYAAIEG